MKMVKSLILGSAAGLIAMSGAQAADLPVKAKAVEYVRICSLYGAGFYYIPGTDTCIKLGGYLRVDITFNGSASMTRRLGPALRPAATGYRNYYIARAREDFNIDTRTATEYGVVRTFFEATFTFDTLGGATFNPTRSATTSAATRPAELAAAATLGVYYAFIQFAGFTMGKAVSPVRHALDRLSGQQLLRS